LGQKILAVMPDDVQEHVIGIDYLTVGPSDEDPDDVRFDQAADSSFSLA
jgi:hypothetical protein